MWHITFQLLSPWRCVYCDRVWYLWTLPHLCVRAGSHAHMAHCKDGNDQWGCKLKSRDQHVTQSAWDKLCLHSSLHIVSFFFYSKFVAQPCRKLIKAAWQILEWASFQPLQAIVLLDPQQEWSRNRGWFYWLWFLYTVQIKGTFNPRRQGRSVRNPYTQRNCCANFCTVICGPFPPRCVCVCGWGLRNIWPTACLLIEWNERRSSLFLSKFLTPSLACFFFSLLDRRGFVDESAVTIEEEPGTGYGATSSVPKVSSHGHP